MNRYQIAVVLLLGLILLAMVGLGTVALYEPPAPPQTPTIPWADILATDVP